MYWPRRAVPLRVHDHDDLPVDNKNRQNDLLQDWVYDVTAFVINIRGFPVVSEDGWLFSQFLFIPATYTLLFCE